MVMNAGNLINRGRGKLPVPELSKTFLRTLNSKFKKTLSDREENGEEVNEFSFSMNISNDNAVKLAFASAKEKFISEMDSKGYVVVITSEPFNWGHKTIKLKRV